MAIKGTTGKTSRTILLHVIMGALQAGLGMGQLMQQMFTPEQYMVIFMILSGIHTGLGIYLRTITTEPLS
jgi:uncharacterized membrane protein